MSQKDAVEMCINHGVKLRLSSGVVVRDSDELIHKASVERAGEGGK